MDIKSYAEVLKWAIKAQIGYIADDAEGISVGDAEYHRGYYEGMQRGLEIALEKIEASMFLAK
jgi:hypothetical protein